MWRGLSRLTDIALGAWSVPKLRVIESFTGRLLCHLKEFMTYDRSATNFPCSDLSRRGYRLVDFMSRTLA
jgi:hypothetical protein